jgi:hypothetical protein
MSIEKKIEELQRQLAIKTAYLNVEVKFKKGITIPKEAKDLVVNQLKKACAQLAEDRDAIPLDTKGNTQVSTEDLLFLKQMREAVGKKLSSKTEPTNEVVKDTGFSNNISEAIKKVSNRENVAQLLTIDSIEARLRRKIPPQACVEVIEKQGEKTIVDYKGIRFFINTEDLNFNVENQGEQTNG